MSYKSPIAILYDDFGMKLKQQTEDNVCEAVMNVGITVDKAELIKALEYDRDQYYHGKHDTMAHIIKALMDLRDEFVAKQPKTEWYKDKIAQGVEKGIEMCIEKVREMETE